MLKIKQTFNLKLSGTYTLRSTGYIALVLVAPGRLYIIFGYEWYMPCRMYVSHLYAQRGLALLVRQADQE